MTPLGPNFTTLSGIPDKDYALFINTNTARGTAFGYTKVNRASAKTAKSVLFSKGNDTRDIRTHG